MADQEKDGKMTSMISSNKNVKKRKMKIQSMQQSNQQELDQHCQRLEKMGSIRRKLHNDCVIMTEIEMKTKLPSTKSREEETMTFEHSSSSANTLRIASSHLKHIKAAAEEQRLRTS